VAFQRAGKVFYYRGHSAMSEIRPGMIDWDKVLDGCGWFHWTGITPAISQGAADVCAEAIQAANTLKITVSADLNYRKNLWKYGKTAREVMPALVEGCDIICGNEEDAEMSLGIKPEGIDVRNGHLESGAYASVSKQIIKRFTKCRKVLTTLRSSVSASHNNWSGILFDGAALLTARTYPITHIVDRIGAGDAFSAAMIYGFLHFAGDDQKTLDFAVAASCLKHSIPGDYNRVTVPEVMKLMEGDGSGRVSR